MGWIESPSFFCAASETSRDVAEQYCHTPLGTLPLHKFTHYMEGSDSFNTLETEKEGDSKIKFLLEVFVDDFIKVALFSDNSPTVSWVDRLAARQSRVGARLVRALALRLKIKKACPLTPLHVAGKQNSMADMASRSFGSIPKWICTSDASFSQTFNMLFPLPAQNTWTVFCLSNSVYMRVISVLRMTDSTLAEWQRIPKIGQQNGRIGAPMSNLWEWTLTLNLPPIPNELDYSLGLQRERERDTMVAENKSKLQQSLQLSRALARRLHWNVRETLPKYAGPTNSFRAFNKCLTGGKNTTPPH